MKLPECPKCGSQKHTKSGVVNDRQRYKCKNCDYNYTVSKLGKEIDAYYVVKALQLYLEGISYREIERILGVSHVSVMNWVKKYGYKRPTNNQYRPTYKVLTHSELVSFISQKSSLKEAGMVLTELGDKYMMIKWERFRE
ncbi:MAG: helix-turn-helix domain-containing protein [Cyclobacteriaceae bacterium]